MEEVKDYAYPLLMAQKCLKMTQAELLKKNDIRAAELLSVTMKWVAEAQQAILEKHG
jgi:hypothetical protein